MSIFISKKKNPEKLDRRNGFEKNENSEKITNSEIVGAAGCCLSQILINAKLSKYLEYWN